MMKKLILICGFVIGFIPVMVVAHGGEDHDEKAEKKGENKKWFSAESNSDIYELLLRYAPVEPGKPAKLSLFVSNYETNKPVDNASIKITTQDGANIPFIIKPNGNGSYEITCTFPEKKSYALTININSSLGPDLMLINDVEVGKKLDEANGTQSFWSKKWVLFVGGTLAGILLMVLIGKLWRRRVKATFLLLLILFASVPYPISNTYAHGDEDHGDDSNKKGSNGLTPVFIIQKETQFLFELLTEKVSLGNFTESTRLFGTVLPSSGGQALVQSPQTGKITSLKVNVGQKVSKGQTLAIIEQNIDAGTQVNFLTEKNNIQAEYEAAKKEYERLQSIADIVAKKDLAESEARYHRASENKKVLEGLSNSSSGNSKLIYLKSPINGIVGNFTYSIGSTINAGETIFTVTDLSKVYVEAQVFDKDAVKVKVGGRFMVECSNDDHKTQEVRLLSIAQNINSTNQSQRVLFEMNNPDGDFKIGEFVNIRVFAAKASTQLALPNSAISEINGRQAVFIKDHAEEFSLRYIATGENNGQFTTITKGIVEGERIVINAVYQAKMIYMNQ